MLNEIDLINIIHYVYHCFVSLQHEEHKDAKEIDRNFHPKNRREE